MERLSPLTARKFFLVSKLSPSCLQYQIDMYPGSSLSRFSQHLALNSLAECLTRDHNSIYSRQLQPAFSERHKAHPVSFLPRSVLNLLELFLLSPKVAPQRWYSEAVAYGLLGLARSRDSVAGPDEAARD